MDWYEAMKRFALQEQEESELDDDVEEGADPADPGGGDPEVVPGVPRSAIPDYLKGQPPEAIRAALDRAFSQQREEPKSNREIEELRREVAELRQKGEGPKEPAAPEKPLDELLYEDPEAAIDRVIRKRYGHHLADLDQRVGETVFSTVKAELDDFDDYEDDVRDLLKKSGAPSTRANIVGAYKMVLGERAMAERKTARTKARNPERPKPTPDKPAKPKLSDLEKEFAAAEGMSAEEYTKWRDDDAFDVKVPTG